MRINLFHNYELFKLKTLYPNLSSSIMLYHWKVERNKLDNFYFFLHQFLITDVFFNDAISL